MRETHTHKQQNKRIIRWWKLNTHTHPQTHINNTCIYKKETKIKENPEKHNVHTHPHPHNIRRLKLLLEWEQAKQAKEKRLKTEYYKSKGKLAEAASGAAAKTEM